MRYTEFNSQEHLTEIDRISPYSYLGGVQYLWTTIPPYNPKPLPGGSGFLYTINKQGPFKVINIWDPEKTQLFPKPTKRPYEDSYDYLHRLQDWQQTQKPPVPKRIAKLELTDADYFPVDNALMVSAITVDESYRGMGLAKSLYGIALSILKQPLLAGDQQTPGGRTMWVSLSQIPGVEVQGYISIPDSVFDKEPKIIDTVMGKIGGDYIGKTSSRRSSDHYFAFDVLPNQTGRELTAYVKQKLARVYAEPYNVKTGLYAVWKGN